MDIKKRVLPVTGLAQGKPSQSADCAVEDQLKKKKTSCDGLVGLVNIGNSCYMNATVQALSNCPPFRQYFVECHSGQTQNYSTPTTSDSLSALFKKMWTSEKHPGHLSPRPISSCMKNKMFRGTQQQDAQEFLRCLLTQVHDEIGVHVPDHLVCVCGQISHDQHCCHRDSVVSYDSTMSMELTQKSTISVKNSPLAKKRTKQKSSSSSPGNQTKFSFPKGKSKLLSTSSAKSSVENIPSLGGVQQHGGSKLSLPYPSSTAEPVKPSSADEASVKWSKEDLFVVDLLTRKVKVHPQYFAISPTTDNCKSAESTTSSSCNDIPSSASHDQLGSKVSLSSTDSSIFISCSSSHDCLTHKTSSTSESPHKEPQSLKHPRPSDRAGQTSDEGVDEASHHEGSDTTTTSNCREVSPKSSVSGEEDHRSVSPSPVPPVLQLNTGRSGVPIREKQRKGPPLTTSIVSEVFEGLLESRVKCLMCKKVSATREPFQDLSLPIPGRKEMAKFNMEHSSEGGARGSGEDSGRSKSSFSRGLSNVWNFMTALTRDYVSGPPTDITDCLNAFFDTSELKGDNRYYCSNCKSFQNSLKETSIVKLPEVLCIHFKRFRFDGYLSTKISRHITFPLTGLDLSHYHKDSFNPSTQLYDLNAVVTHYGGAGGGHYVAFAKNTSRSSWFEYNDTKVSPVSPDTVQNVEGYVLFYRKVTPRTSHASQSLDISSLLPKPGTLLPSPDVCYISRHWLYLLKHLSHPGPIVQFEYACKHGAVVPKKTDRASSLALCIRREDWNKLEGRYGGGPLVPLLEACTSCQDLLVYLTERRKLERETVHQLQTQERQVEKERKSEPYLLSIEWLQQWQRFIHCTTIDEEPPGPIDNTPLLHMSQENQVTLVEGASFRKLSPAAWNYFTSIYNGGPTIVTSLEALQ